MKMLNGNLTFPNTSNGFEAMLEAFFCVQHNEHMKAWKWELYTRGITVDAYGRKRSSRTGELVG